MQLGPMAELNPSEEALRVIMQTLKELYPGIVSDYHAVAVADLVQYYTSVGKLTPPDDAFQVNFTEMVQVKVLNNIADQIASDILEKCIPYEGMSCLRREPANEFERGVFSAIGLIRHRVHCICDD